MGGNKLGQHAYMAARNADCFYEPDVLSPSRITPSMGERVEVVRTQGDWVLIRLFGKTAWAPRNNLSSEPVPGYTPSEATRSRPFEQRLADVRPPKTYPRIDRGELGPTAFIVVSKANCLYEPHVNGAIRITPRYGAQVNVLESRGDWAQIEFWDVKAWTLRTYLAQTLIEQQQAEDIGFEASGFYSGGAGSASGEVEYGPRGGRFVRTSQGFRRYL